jgi:hypothetical protein
VSGKGLDFFTNPALTLTVFRANVLRQIVCSICNPICGGDVLKLLHPHPPLEEMTTRGQIMNVFRTLAIGLVAWLALLGIASAQKWQSLKHPPTVQTDTALLLTDGTAMVHQYNSPNWWRLTPDMTGSYVNGTWSQLASMPSDYAPLYFASAVLADGRVIVEGGEYNFLRGVETNLGAIYDPVKNKWKNVNPPNGWSEIGDSPAIVLPNGTFMLGQNFTTATAFFNAKTLGWTLKGSGKADTFSEEGWELLPNRTVLTVDTQNTPNSERFLPKTNTWVNAGSTIANLAINSSLEIGPALLRPEGNVFAMGANGNAAGHTALYNTANGKWAAGPDFPSGNDMADAPAAVLPDGNVLCETSPGVFNTPVTFYEFDGSKFHLVPSPSNTGSPPTSYQGRLLVLPTGQVLYTLADGASIDAEIYTAKGTAKSAWAPTITSAPATVTRGQSYSISGTQFNGLSAGAAYGDDVQIATSYPLVRITNNTSGHVFYARTHNHSTMAVATGSRTVSTHFDVPSGMETGASSLVVVANGIASTSVAVTVQ